MKLGDQVFRDLMDLDLVLQDGDKMLSIKVFLASVDPSSDALRRFQKEILTFKKRIETLADVAGREMSQSQKKETT